MSDELAGLKAIQRAIWTAGDYDAIAELFWEVGAVVAETAAIEPGMKVLDVATGTGNAAIRAAAGGCGGRRPGPHARALRPPPAGARRSPA